jgi:hypothetical protein
MIIAKATALNVGSTIATATVEVESRTGDKTRACAFSVVTLRTVALPAL